MVRSSKLLRVYALVLALALALVVYLLTIVAPSGPVSPVAAGAAPKAGGSVELTPQQRKEFVAGAREVAGLNRAQIADALEDPATLAAIPVSAEVRTVETQPAAQQVQEEGTRSSLAAAVYCKPFKSVTNYRNAYGTLLARYKVTKSWCWDYAKIVSVTLPQVSGFVTRDGASLGWRYNGVTERSDYYFTYKNVKRGGHASYRKGSFSICNSSGCLPDQTPQISILVHYDGYGYQSSPR